jgi:hypothetical protein
VAEPAGKVARTKNVSGAQRGAPTYVPPEVAAEVATITDVDVFAKRQTARFYLTVPGANDKVSFEPLRASVPARSSRATMNCAHCHNEEDMFDFWLPSGCRLRSCSAWRRKVVSRASKSLVYKLTRQF